MTLMVNPIDDENKPEYPVVQAGQSVTIQLRDRQMYRIDADGNKTDVEYMAALPEVKLIHDRDQCWNDDWADDYMTTEEAAHTTTICPECIEQWAIDYHIELTTDLSTEGLI